MNEYTFEKLNDKEFESLSIDLLSKLENQRIERFKPGKDSGIDGRFFTETGSETIIQCKHWIKSGLQALIRHLKKDELDKIKKIQPKRYIIVTSLPLSRHNKKTIKNLLSPYILSESDVFGKEDLNDLISQNPDIEQKHYKLWLFSTSVLKYLLNSAVLGRSEFKYQEIINFSSKYVLTSNHKHALEKLKSLHSIIITGEPGIGKTTLADHLCLYYASNGFELCFIQDSITEAETLYSKDRKQMFYFDDFLGRNFLSALGRHEDSQVINFIRRVGRDNSKRFILTSRTTVLNQGKRLSDLFRIENIDRNEYELNIKSLSNLDKARILYNHIWFSTLDEQYVQELYINKRYREIIKHRNFNPRLISFITDSHKILNIEPGQYWSYIEDVLNNPADIWSHVFDSQLNQTLRMAVCLVVFNGKEIQEKFLRESFDSIRYRLNPSQELSDAFDFDNAIRLLVGAVLNRTIKQRTNEIVYDLFNPAVGDFVLTKYSRDPNVIKNVFLSLNTIASLNNLKSLKIGRILNSHVVEQTLKSILHEKVFNYALGIPSAYCTRAAYLAIEDITFDKKLNDEFAQFLSNFALQSIQSALVEESCKLLLWTIKENVIQNNDDRVKSFVDSCYDYTSSFKEYTIIWNLIKSLDENLMFALVPEFKRHVVEFWQDSIGEKVDEAGIIEHIFDHADENEATLLVQDYIFDQLNLLELDFDDDEFGSILDCLDISNAIEENVQRNGFDEYDHERWREVNTDLDRENEIIDDLFERG